MTVQYQAGRFGFSSETEDITSFKKSNKNKQIKSKGVYNRVELKFVDEEDIPIVAMN